MTDDLRHDPELEWLYHVRPTGLVLSPMVIRECNLVPERQTQADNDDFAQWLDPDDGQATIAQPWAFLEGFLNWEARHVAGAPGGPAVPENLAVHVVEHDTTLAPDLAVAGFEGDGPWQLLVKFEPGIDPDKRGGAEGWEATAHQRFERLLRETGVEAGVMLTDKELRLTYAPRGETSGWLSFPLRSLAEVSGRPMLAGLRLLLGGFRLFRAPTEHRLQSLLRQSREAQAAVSTRLAEQVLGALHELLRGLDAAEGDRIRRLARDEPQHLYEGLLAVLMRLVFILYAEDRDILPSRTDGVARQLYENDYSIRGLYGRLSEDVTLNPDTMEERFGGWGQLLALFRLIHAGHRSGFVIARRGKLFDPDVFPFLEGRDAKEDPPVVAKVTDGCLLRILEGLMTIEEPVTRSRERLSYRTLDVEQIGSVYEIVMGFTVQTAPGRMLAIKAGKKNRTPVFVDLDALSAAKPSEREKYLKEACDRSSLGAGAKRNLKAATTSDDLAAALDGIVDERASPAKHAVNASTPVLQPTKERRRTGSHYTPRSLTEPIVRKALRPTFERLGGEATPDAILDLKLCDPAMGSGAFLVEACRQLAARLVLAWERYPGTRPEIPPDEDADLLARRMVAQRCLYGVDRNPMAVDLARLSLWLATLARDHEFTFLDHALKCGDSLVGLDREQIEAVHWERDANVTITEGIVRQALADIERERTAIREALDDATEAELRAHLRIADRATRRPKAIGDAVIAAFFRGSKQQERLAHRAELLKPIEYRAADWFTRVTAIAADIPFRPFHWSLEFPEVFDRKNSGFDVIVGNPPFAGKVTLIGSNHTNYLPWLQEINDGSHGNADLVAYFFRRAYRLIRHNGSFGLIATNTVGQGDTRTTGLFWIVNHGGEIYDCLKRIKWPGDAAVTVSAVHIQKEGLVTPHLDGTKVTRISAYLVQGELDGSPYTLSSMSDIAYNGTKIYGNGFCFDDHDDEASPIRLMYSLLEKHPEWRDLIKQYVGGQDINNSPELTTNRYVIDFKGRSLVEAKKYSDLLEIVRSKVLPQREKTRDTPEGRILKRDWWLFFRPKRELYRKLEQVQDTIVIPETSPHLCVAKHHTDAIFSHSLKIIALEGDGAFATLQCRVHEVWARFFGSSLEDRLRYTPSDCFETFPFPEDFETDPALEEAGERYYRYRADLMVARDKGLTKTYNDFHNRDRRDREIEELRRLHHAMDQAVLRGYGWNDLANTASPVFLDESNEGDFTYQGRLFWPSDFRDEVLARLLELNKGRHEGEVRRGLARPTRARTAQRDEDQEELL